LIGARLENILIASHWRNGVGQRTSSRDVCGAIQRPHHWEQILWWDKNRNTNSLAYSTREFHRRVSFREKRLQV